MGILCNLKAKHVLKFTDIYRDHKIPVHLCSFTKIAVYKENVDSFTSWSNGLNRVCNGALDFFPSTAAIISAAANNVNTATANVNVKLSSMFLVRIIKGVSLAILDTTLK